MVAVSPRLEWSSGSKMEYERTGDGGWGGVKHVQETSELTSLLVVMTH